MTKSSLITRWNIAALLVIVAGAAMTLGAEQLWLHHWARSGIEAPIGRRQAVELPAGETLVYYESPGDVPLGLVTLLILGPDRQRVHSRLPQEDNNYRLALGGWSGRALWHVNLPVDGVYEIGCYSGDYMAEGGTPVNDRIVFHKRPNSVDDARTISSVILVTGSTFTFVIAGALYLAHVQTLRRRGLIGQHANINFTQEPWHEHASSLSNA